MSTWGERASYGAFALAAFDFCLRSLDLRNDQFGRISPGRQILTLGELPFRDFLDPGYFLTEFSSAAVQWLLGQNLLGELLLNALFIAVGCLCVCVLARRMTGRIPAALLAGVFALLALPRAYDYDKALFYPLGLLVLFRWLEQPSIRRGGVLAATLVVASMYRYDNGIFLGGAAVIGAVMAFGRDRGRWAAAGAVVAMAGAASALVLVFLQLHGGVANAADQALTYGIREGQRTRITAWPRVRGVTALWSVSESPSSQNHVRVRWTADAVAPAQRRQLAGQLGLTNEQPGTSADGRTFRYTLPDASLPSVRQLVNHPAVEDTDGIDRSQLRLIDPESRLLRLQRVSPLFRVRLLTGAWTFENAEAFLYYALVSLPVLGAFLLLMTRRELTTVSRAEVATLVAFAMILCAFILRDPVSARVGGMAGPFCVLAAWALVTLTRRAPRAGRVASASALVLVAISLAIAVGWHRQLSVPFAHPIELADRLKAFGTVPPPLDLLPSGRVRGIVEYLRACTRPEDRVFTTWFSPEIFYFSQRPFGGAIAANFGGHWSEPRFQRRTIEALQAHPTPVVILYGSTHSQFRAEYRLVDAYLAEHYVLAATQDFGDPEIGPEGYQLMIRRERLPAGAVGPFGLPCLAPQSL